MRRALVSFALAALAIGAAAPARAEDEAHRLDRLEIQRLNREAAARFAQRDAQYRREASQSRDRASEYARARAKYERDMAEWRRRVAACNGGDWSACDGG